MNELKTQN